MKIIYFKTGLAFILLLVIGEACTIKSSSSRNIKVISNESLIKPDTRILHSSLVNNSPGDGMNAEINPPRFRWFYLPEKDEISSRVKPYRFHFQISDNEKFEKPIVDLETEFNFYNELAPLPEGKSYYWRIGYIPFGQQIPTKWSDTLSFVIPDGTPVWDRSILQKPDFSDHPRLMFNKDQLEDLKRAALKDETFNMGIIKTAERMLNHEWWNNWPKTDRNNPEYPDKLFFHLTQDLTQTAFAYLITGDKKYSNILTIWKTIASYPKGGATSPEGMGAGADSEDNTSITEFMACVYDWFYDKLSPEERLIFEKSLEWRISSYMHEFRWGGAIFTGGSQNPEIGRASIAIGGSGHSWEGALATFTAAIAMYEKSEVARRFFHWIANYIISIGEQVAQNGGYDLGAHYGQSHLKWLVYQLMYLSSALPELQTGKNPLYKQYGEFFIGLTPVGLEYSHFGRISQHGAGMAMRYEVFNLLASLTENGEILYNWANTNDWLNKDEKQKYQWRQWIHVAAPLQFKNELKQSPSGQTKYFFPATGFVMAHRFPPSELKAFKEGVGVMFCCRPNRGDDYNNENTFQLYAYGQHCNYGGHSGDENPYGFQTIAHNTIMVDGIGQTTTKEAREKGYRGAILAYKEDDLFTYWMGDATNAYPKGPEIVGATGKGWASRSQIDYDDKIFGEKGAPQLERFRRHILFMRDKYLIIYDDLKTAPGHPSAFSWRYRVLPDANAKYDQKEGLLTYSLDDVKVFVKQIAFPESIDFLDMKDMDQFKNPLTGEDFMKNNAYTKRDMEDERYRKKVCQHNFWFTTKTTLNNHHFMVVVYPVEPGTSSPEITRLDNSTVKVEKDGDSDIISFDKNTKYPATVIVDIEAFRKQIEFEK